MTLLQSAGDNSARLKLCSLGAFFLRNTQLSQHLSQLVSFKKIVVILNMFLSHIIFVWWYWLLCSCEYWGNLLRSVPFLMAGHLNIKTFQTLDTPFFNTNPKNGCPKMICQYSGQAPRHFTCRFHYMSCSTDVRPWDSKRKFVFLLQIVPITKTLVPNALK